MPDDESCEWLVRGRVQGVSFRAATRARALELGLAGVAENLPDGRVRVLARGDADALERLGEWLRQGPRHARVDGVERVEVAPSAAVSIVDGGFMTR